MSYADLVLADTPRLYWRLNDTVSASSIRDYSGNGYNGSIAGTPTLGQRSLISDGGSVQFPGVAGNYLYRPNSVDTQLASPWTQECWYWLDPTQGANGDPMGKASFGGNGYRLMVNVNGTLTMETNTATNYELSTAVGVGTNRRWHHLVGTYDGTNGRLYLDGTLILGPTAMSYAVNTVQDFRVGQYMASTAEPLKGFVTEVALYTAALSQARIAAHYQAGIGGGVSY